MKTRRRGRYTSCLFLLPAILLSNLPSMTQLCSVLILDPVLGLIVLHQVLIIFVQLLPFTKPAPQDVDLLFQGALIRCLDSGTLCCRNFSSGLVTSSEGIGPAVGGFGATDLRHGTMEEELGNGFVFIDQSGELFGEFCGWDVDTSADMSSLLTFFF